jgi:signal transduction histidine kinase
MRPREAVANRAEATVRKWSIPTSLTVAVVPSVVLTLLLGALGAWASYDSARGLSSLGYAAIAISVAVSVGTIFAVRRRGRQMASRIDEVSAAARRVASKDLVDLLDALRNPDVDLDSIAPMTLDTSSEDEIGELARSFEALHRSLVDVGARQMETLRAGVSSIFVTLARRNSSLVDRQLALLDQLESGEEDPEVLNGFYQLDHFATRMRRNAESLLVLAGSESPRVWAKATDMADVVRAAVSEIDEYHRIEVLALEPARLSGGSVSDVSHLVAELLENAVQFSPPSETIRVTGLFDMDGYQLAVSDRGVGISEARIAEMNRVLHRPPALGLSVEPTLGIYVVAKLAHRHGLAVELIRGVPGITARVTIPRDHLEVSTSSDPRPWGSEHTRRIVAERSRAASGTHYSDAETRAYVLMREQERRADEMVPSSGAGAETDQVIDLTRPPYDDGEELAALPVRTPGLAFIEDDEAVSSITPGDGAAEIKSALAAYDRGRRSAENPENGPSAEDRDDEEWA